MSRLPILYYPDKRLRTIADPVSVINNKVQTIIDNMFETMYFQQGIGLAATQINFHQRIIVIDISKNKDQKIVLINPKFLYKYGNEIFEEGCLSIPNIRASISRANKIKIQALNYFGKKFFLKAEGLLSICIQHEMDHLIGKLFIDYLDKNYKKNIKMKFI
ncbi:MAG: peptide deformylase [Wigglesworthia glossinidia]|nr:peptide deformylase [Wigglesworthia glossinidia]